MNFTLSVEKKQNVKHRWEGAGTIIALALILILFGLFADPRHKSSDGTDIDGFAFFLPYWANAIFACLFITCIISINIFISIELDGCFTKSKSKKTIGLILLILIISQILPNILMLYSVYWGHNFKWLSYSRIIYFSLIFINLVWIAPLYMISKKSKNASKFNNICFPLIVTVISFSLTGACYLTVVRGIFTTLIVVLVCVFCDVGGFAAGMRFGKHKFAPVISPKKTWEGVIGSFIFSYVVFFTLMVLIGVGNGQSVYQMQGNLLGNQWNINVHTAINPGQYGWYLLLAVFLFILNVFSIGGDLIFSLFKRKNGIKDYSQLIKGHGGVLDRIDSWIAVLALFYVTTLIIGGISTIITGWHNSDHIFNYYYVG